ncbi:carbohydrate ABC transporter permease [Cohnella zeiphila]|uniref:Carbohydrate ABC transporter permease n=1 Tax=Cohnella zeiphila TaxID=2761120 RepID=A0A7X0SQQ6_9BACL|nr:carbohydrate ABC transporter permease [Cohnella zeiphila]MBB6734402.1 carbohydrate ABC transporter permease [Cohnella zeiphila]
MRESPSYRMFNIMNYAALGLLALATCYPFYFILIYSLSEPSLVVGHPSFLVPRSFTLVNYSEIFKKNDLTGPLLISIGRTVIGTLITLFGCSMFAFGLTKRATPFRKPMYIVVILTMYIQAGLIPNYILMYELHLLNTFWIYVIPGLVNAFFLVLIKTYFEQLPPELEEAAMMEGAGYFTVFRRIALPLSKPILATITIFAAVGQWNNWMDNLIYNSRQELMTLQLMLLRFLQTQQFSLRDAALLSASQDTLSVTPTSLRMTITVLVVIPVFLVYPFLQKHFVKGIMIGAIKG